MKHGYSEGAGHGILDVYAALQPITSNDFTNSLYSGRSSNLLKTVLNGIIHLLQLLH